MQKHVKKLELFHTTSNEIQKIWGQMRITGTEMFLCPMTYQTLSHRGRMLLKQRKRTYIYIREVLNRIEFLDSLDSTWKHNEVLQLLLGEEFRTLKQLKYVIQVLLLKSIIPAHRELRQNCFRADASHSGCLIETEP